MILLSVDTSGTKGSLALARLENNSLKNIDQVEWSKKAMHSEVATVELQELLRRTKIDLRGLTHLAVNVGPGSFTGLRVGISLVKTLSFSLNIPVYTINTLESLAFTKTSVGDTVFVATRAVQNFYYVAAYSKSSTGLANLLSPRSAEEPELEKLSAGYTKVLVEGKTPQFEPVSEARCLVEFLVGSGFSPSISDWKSVLPLYLRASEAEEKLKKGLLKPL